MDSYFPNASSAIQSQMARERVLEDLHNLVIDSETLLAATVGELSEQASLARDRLKAGLDRAKLALEELQEKGLASAKAATRQVDQTIRDHPYESIGVALGVGLAIGLLLRRH